MCVLRAYPLGFALKYLKYFDYLKKNKGFLRIEPAKALPTHILKRERERQGSTCIWSLYVAACLKLKPTAKTLARPAFRGDLELSTGCLRPGGFIAF